MPRLNKLAPGCALLLALVLAGTPAHADERLSAQAFTEAYVAALTAAESSLEIVIEEPLVVDVRTDDGNQGVMLGNAFEIYEQNPGALDEILTRYVSSALETLRGTEETLTIDNIMPVIKDTAWLPQIQARLRESGATDEIDYYFEPLAEGLVIFYVIDTPSNIRYVSRDVIDESGIPLADLRKTAVHNLGTLLADLSAAQEDGLYALFLDGNYDPGLMLIDEVWDAANFELKGDLVVSIPTREGVLISGTDEKAGLTALAGYSDEFYDSSPYRLTRDFYKRDGDKWVLWKRRQ